MFNYKLNKMKKAIVAVVFLLGTISFASAQQGPNIRHTQQHQFMRINNGVCNGSLTGPEARQLLQQQHRIQHQKRLANSDGQMTQRERNQIRQQQRIANREIYRQKHDRQNRNK